LIRTELANSDILRVEFGVYGLGGACDWTATLSDLSGAPIDTVGSAGTLSSGNSLLGWISQAPEYRNRRSMDRTF